MFACKAGGSPKSLKKREKGGRTFYLRSMASFPYKKWTIANGQAGVDQEFDPPPSGGPLCSVAKGGWGERRGESG